MVRKAAAIDSTVEELTAWGASQEKVRAMVLTSSRAIPDNPAVDRYSDYDVILALRDVRPFHESRKWLAAFGTVLAMYRDPMYEKDGVKWSANVVQFEEGLKVDFNLWPIEMMRRVAKAERLPVEFDAGYQVLLDKDRLTEGIRSPSYRGYIPKPPTEERYREVPATG